MVDKELPIDLQEMLSFMGFVINQKELDIDFFDDSVLEQLILFAKEELKNRNIPKQLH